MPLRTACFCCGFEPSFWMQELRHKWVALNSCSTAISSYTCAFVLEMTVLGLDNCSGFSGSWLWKPHGWNEKVLKKMCRSRRGVGRDCLLKRLLFEEEKLFHYHVLFRGLRLAWGSQVPLKGVAFRSTFSSDLHCLCCLKVSVVKMFLF